MTLLQSCKGVSTFILIGVPVAVALVLKESSSTGPSEAITKQDNVVLFLGCSLDKMMVDYCEKDKCPKKGFHFEFAFNRGVSPPLFHLKDEHKTKKSNLSPFESVELAAIEHPNASMVVVSSDLWDIAAWWEQGNRPGPPYDYTAQLDKWANTEIPAFMQHIKQQFPQSRLVFRSAPTTLKTTPYGATPKAMQQMYNYTKAMMIDGQFLGEFAFFDYYDVMKNLLTKWEALGRSPSTLYIDEMHPGDQGMEAYMENIFDMF